MFGPRVSRFLIAYRWPLLACATLLAMLSYGPSSQLEFDRSVENMFAEDDPLLRPYKKLKRIFGGNEIALAAYNDDQLLTQQGIQRLETLTQQMRATPGVSMVVSLSATPMGQGIVDSALLEPFCELLENYAVSTDRKTAGLVCMLVPEDETDASREETLLRLRELVEMQSPESGVLTGEPVMVVDGFRYLAEDGRRLGATATGLLMLTIILCFRSLRWVLIPVIVVQLTLWLTKAVLVWCDFRLTMVSSMLWAIVTVVGVATVIHIIVRFRTSRTEGLPPREALFVALGALATPIIWTCFTDAAGFTSLLAANVGPVRDFGLMMGIGSLLSLVCVAIIVPGLSLLGERIESDPKRAWGEAGLDFGLYALVHAIERWPRFFGAVTILIVGTASVGYLWLDVETDFTRNFRSTAPIVRSYGFVEENLGGAGVWDILIPAPEELTREYLDRVRELERRLRTQVTVTDEQGRSVPGLTKILSVVDAIDAVTNEELREVVPVEVLTGQMTELMPQVVSVLLSEDPRAPDQHYLRIMLRARERQPADQKTHLIAEVERICHEEFPDAEVTGFFILMTNIIQSMVQDQWRTFGIASLAIGLMMFIVFRRPLLALIALVPNMLPIIVLTGLMGWLGVRINMGAAMIAAVSMGLSVDCSIHYITEYLRVREDGKTIREAINFVHQSVGRAMVFSTLGLMVGFSALCFSQFIPLVYFGVLVSLSMFGGLSGNLVLLPILLRLVEPKQRPDAAQS
jgi:predicted RND superfamily exporter protein